jgi:hypothetical protein
MRVSIDTKKEDSQDRSSTSEEKKRTDSDRQRDSLPTRLIFLFVR